MWGPLPVTRRLWKWSPSAAPWGTSRLSVGRGQEVSWCCTPSTPHWSPRASRWTVVLTACLSPQPPRDSLSIYWPGEWTMELLGQRPQKFNLHFFYFQICLCQYQNLENLPIAYLSSFQHIFYFLLHSVSCITALWSIRLDLIRYM